MDGKAQRQFILELGVIYQTNPCGFQPHLLQLLLFYKFGDCEEQRTLDDMHLATDLFQRLEAITRVGEEVRARGCDEDQAVRAGVISQIANIRGRRNQQRVDLVLAKTCGDSLAALFNFSQTNSLANLSLVSPLFRVRNGILTVW